MMTKENLVVNYNIACEQAHLFEWGASAKSWREEWGEVKWPARELLIFEFPAFADERSDPIGLN